MKLVVGCPHVGPTDQDRWMDHKDEGTYTIIQELCKECFIEGARALGAFDPDTPVKTWKGEERTLKDYGG